MSFSNAYFRCVTGFEGRATVGGSAISTGASSRVQRYAQPLWYDLAGIPNRIQKVGFKTGTLAAGASASIDLTALDSPDGSVGSVSLSSLVCCCILITDGTGKLRIGNAGTNPHPLDFGAVTHTRTILPGGPHHIVGDPSGTGYAVSSTVKVVQLTNTDGANPVTYLAYFGGN